MSNYSFWLRVENLRPIRFYAYTSAVMCKILSQSHNYKTAESEFLDDLGTKLQEVVESKGIHWDNKVVVECEIEGNYHDQKAISNVFIGQYDGVWSVGFGVHGDKWIKPIEIQL